MLNNLLGLLKSVTTVCQKRDCPISFLIPLCVVIQTILTAESSAEFIRDFSKRNLKGFRFRIRRHYFVNYDFGHDVEAETVDNAGFDKKESVDESSSPLLISRMSMWLQYFLVHRRMLLSSGLQST